MGIVILVIMIKVDLSIDDDNIFVLKSDKFHGEKAIEIYLPIMNKYQLQFGDYTKIFTLNYGEIKIINIGPKDMESNNKTEEI